MRGRADAVVVAEGAHPAHLLLAAGVRWAAVAVFSAPPLSGAGHSEHMSTGSSEPTDLDGLRRRLFGPDASAEDVARYEEAAGGPTRVPPPSGPERPRTGAPRVAVAVAALVVVVALGVGVGVGAGAVAGRTSAAPTTSATSRAPTSSVLLAQLPAPASARSAFERSLAAGRGSGLLAYLSAHPDLLPPAIRTVGRADSTEYSGDGTTTLSLSPSALAERGGRVTVILVLARTGRYLWRSIRVPATADRVAAGAAVTSAGGQVQAGAPVAGTFTYGRGAPARLTVVVADGTRWGAAVVFTD
ncbi:MAG: hypothetical protein HIU86_01875 [Acidobacteria bacterium]|nr:hypothetical protein [Acidobacteriota bacterium]